MDEFMSKFIFINNCFTLEEEFRKCAFILSMDASFESIPFTRLS